MKRTQIKLEPFYVWLHRSHLTYGSVIGNCIREGCWSTRKQEALSEAKNEFGQQFVYKIAIKLSNEVKDVSRRVTRGSFELRDGEQPSLDTFIEALKGLRCTGDGIGDWDAKVSNRWFGWAKVRKIKLPSQRA